MAFANTMGFDRRALLMDASSLVLAGSAASLAQAAPAALAAAPIGRVATIAALANADPQLHCVDVLGYADATDAGGGLFVWRPSAPVRADAGVRIASDHVKDGHWLRLSYEGGRVRPEWFGSRQKTADHSTLIQAAIAFVVAEGSGRVDLGNSTYHCKSRIVLDPTRCILAGSGAVLDFSDRVAPSDTPVVDLERLRGMAHGSWSVAPKGLVHTPYEFTELAVPLEMTAGGRYRVTYKIDQLAGDPNNPFVRLQVYCDGLQDPVASLPTSAPDRIALEFEWPSKTPTGRLAFSCNSKALITEFELRAVGAPECILVRADEGSPQYGHLWLEGFRVRGSERDVGAMRLHGIRFETKGSAKSSRAAVRDLEVEGFETAVVMADRAYLIHFYNSRLIGDVGVHFLHASQDAGENITFHGCTIGGSRIGIWNGGAEINMFGSSVDFAEQFYVGTGVLNAQSCHFETNRTTRSDQYLFDISEGSVNIDASYLMIGGGDFAAGNQADYIVNLRSPFAGFAVANTYCYNLRTRTGIFAGGNGRFQSRNLSGIAMNPIAPLPKYDALSNLFGPASHLSGGSIGIDFRLIGGERFSRTSVANGSLSLQPAGDGGVLALEKTGEESSSLELWLLAPCHPGVKIGWSLDAAVGTRGDVQELPIGVSFVQVISRDERGGPLLGSIHSAKQSDTAVRITKAEGWRSVQGSTFETRYGDANDGSAPGFATHVALRVDATSLKRGDQLLIRMPYAGVY